MLNWNQFRSDYAQSHGKTSKEELSNAYAKYKISVAGGGGQDNTKSSAQAELFHNWSKEAPKSKKERKALLDKCGPRSFLDPALLKYPIVPKNSTTCKPVIEGIIAAEKRAAQHHHPNIVKKALILKKKARSQKLK